MEQRLQDDTHMLTATLPDIIPVAPVVANLNVPQADRYLRLALQIKVSPSAHTTVRELYRKKSAEIRNWLIGYLSDQPVSLTVGRESQERMRSEIRNAITGILQTDQITDILFAEFNVQ